MHARSLRRIWPAVFLLIAILGPQAAQGSSLVYKNYIVRYDRGWDVLCEPYVVQSGDWVLKIFRQKGEIANQDFRDFLGIFQRLNPHVPDIDLVRPGQAVDIPLRKLEHGVLPGQESGVVTIPIVTLSADKEQDKDLKNQEASQQQKNTAYEVQRGDTLYKIVTERYGRFGTKEYRQGIDLLKATNPDIKDVNRIFAGQQIYLPDPATREKQWEALAGQKGGTGQTGPDETSGGSMQAAQTPTPQAPRDPLAAAAATVGGRLTNKGTYYIPRDGAGDLEIDLSRHPLMELGPNRLLFSQDGKIMGQAPETLEKQWPQTKVVSFSKEDSAQQIIAAIFDKLQDKDKDKTSSVVGFEDQGVRVAVQAKWIKPEGDGRQLCITPIQTVGEQTPESMRRYLEQNGIVLKEVLPGGAAAPSASDSNRHAVKNILALTPTSQRDFVQGLSKALNYSYAPNVPVTFPYAGIQIEAFSNLVATRDGREVLLDFGELYGGAAKAIAESGLNLVQIGADENYLAIAAKMISGLSERASENPSFLAARRPAQYNTMIIVPGLLYTDAQNKRTLLSDAPLHPAVTDLLNLEGIAVVTWQGK